MQDGKGVPLIRLYIKLPTWYAQSGAKADSAACSVLSARELRCRSASDTSHLLQENTSCKKTYFSLLCVVGAIEGCLCWPKLF